MRSAITRRAMASTLDSASVFDAPYAITPGRAGISAIQRPSSSRSNSISQVTQSVYRMATRREDDGDEEVFAVVGGCVACTSSIGACSFGNSCACGVSAIAAAASASGGCSGIFGASGMEFSRRRATPRSISEIRVRPEFWRPVSPKDRQACKWETLPAPVRGVCNIEQTVPLTIPNTASDG